MRMILKCFWLFENFKKIYFFEVVKVFRVWSVVFNLILGMFRVVGVGNIVII